MRIWGSLAARRRDSRMPPVARTNPTRRRRAARVSVRPVHDPAEPGDQRPVRADHAEQRGRDVRQPGRARHGGPGFHHSNWLFVPASNPATGVIGPFDGPDGTFTCADRGFDQAVAALKGGVLFAQSTQAQHDVQKFPAGAVIQIPAHSKIVATIHLLNAVRHGRPPVAGDHAHADPRGGRHDEARRVCRSRTTRSACRRT